MMKQQTLAIAADQEAAFANYRKPTRRDEFLKTMESIVPWAALCEVIEPYGRDAVAGAIGGPMVMLDGRTLYLKDLRLFGCTVLGETVFSNLVRRIEAGDIKPLVAQTFALDQIREAQTQF